MWSALGGLFGGAANAGLSFLGGMANTALSSRAQRRLMQQQYEYQLDMMNRQQSFAKEMANTAHQREVVDLRKAGLNPILSATGGNGAPSPVVTPGSAPSGSSVGSPNIRLDRLMESVSTAAQIKGIRASADKAVADAKKARADAKLSEGQLELTKETAKKVAAEAKEIGAGLPWQRIPGSALQNMIETIKTGHGLLQERVRFWDRQFKNRFKRDADFININGRPVRIIDKKGGKNER